MGSAPGRLVRSARVPMVAVVVVSLALGACAEDREGPVPVDLVTWVDDVAPVVAARCAACHGATAPAGGYDLSSYLGALGAGTDAVANAVAGDAGSAILAVLASGDGVHDELADAATLLRAWVVDSRLAYRDSRIHDPGILNPADPHFHGAELASRAWDFKVCQRCHGDDFAGGASGTSCKTCHADGPTACDTCHGAIPANGAHHAHVEGLALQRPVACAECHRVPTRWDEPGHLFDATGAVDPPPAEVVLGALANRDLTPPRRTAPASYDPATRTCSGVYCHGGVIADATATDPSPKWDDGAVASTCGGCHGAPPASHAQSDCGVCHQASITLGGAFAAGHLDGAIETGDGSGTCTDCHGSGGNPAPPHGLHGEQATSALAVGAHRVHLSPSGLTGAIACGECHVVPATVDATGHIDTALPAEVFAPGSGIIARADGSTPTWDRTAGTCSGVYCHGGGGRLALDLSPGVRAPAWTGSEQAYCGSCHGLPPADPYHAPDLGLTDCTTCHPDVDGFGNILVTGDPPTSEHIDGTIDLR